MVAGDQGRVSGCDGPRARGSKGPGAVAAKHSPTAGTQRKEGWKPLSPGLIHVFLLDLSDRLTAFVIEAPPHSGGRPRWMTGSWSSMTVASAVEAHIRMEVAHGFLDSNVLCEKGEGYHGLCVLLVVLPSAVASEQPLNDGRQDRAAPMLVSRCSVQGNHMVARATLTFPTQCWVLLELGQAHRSEQNQ